MSLVWREIIRAGEVSGGYVRGVKCPSPSLVAGAAFSDRRPLLLAVSGFARHRDADSVRLIRTNLIDDNAVLSSA